MKPNVINILKKHPFISSFIILITLLELVPAGTYTLLNAATYTPVKGFKLIIPWIKYIFEPFIGIPVYLSTTHYIKAESISLFIWGILFILLYTTIKKRYSKIPVYIMTYMLGFSLFAVYVLFTKFPLLGVMPENSSYCLVDPHSHTFYSHDGLVSPMQNMQWHINQGFTGWYVTEHYNISGAINEQDLAIMSGYTSMIGEEVRVDNDPHFFLALGLTAPVSAHDITTVSALTSAVHKHGGAVVLALWWLDGKTDLEHYVKDGVDAFEIANAGHKQRLYASVRRMTYRMSQKYHIPLIASSDWHGWGNYAYTWTAFKISGGCGGNPSGLNNEIISLLRNNKDDRQNNKIIPIIYDYPYQYWGTLRFIFGPFFDFYYYFSTLPFKGYVSWVVWTVLLWVIYTIYTWMHKQFFYKKQKLLGHMLFITAGIMALYHAVKMIIGFTFIPVGNTLLLTVVYVLLFYSSGMLLIAVLWLYISTVRKGD